LGGNEIDNINWEIHSTSIYKLSHDKRRFIQKFIHNKLPCNYYQHKYYAYKSPLCKTCNIEIETQHHILTCQSCPTRNKTRNKFYQDINTITDKHRIKQATKQVICQNIENYLNSQCDKMARDIAQDATISLVKATAKQSAIGWEH
jgi:hypothetical protein